MFKNYNESVFPAQIIFNLMALLGILLLFKRQKNNDKIISAILSFLWLWIGIVYHLLFFSKINTAAYGFGILFIIQGIIFFYFGVLKDQLSFTYRKDIYSFIGFIFLLYALIIYPILGHISGHQYPYSPTFGLPCPTTIYTFGFLMFLKNKISIKILIIPFLWSLLGFSAAVQLSVYEDFGLLIAGILASSLLIIRNKKISTSQQPV